MSKPERTLEHSLGGAHPIVQHYRRPAERAFTRAERAHVTLLIGGLTERQNALIVAAGEGLQFKIASAPTPTKADFQTGKEYCSPGMCNPAYFTIGALVNYLKRLRDVEGLPVARIVDEYVFVTAGSCGPCRFGVYESEYQLALRNSGFDGFRVLVFQQKGGVGQNGQDGGMEIDVAFARGLMSAILIGDLLNDLANQIRPYEVVRGQTDRTFEKVVRRMGEALRVCNRPEVRVGLAARLLGWLIPAVGAEGCQRILDQILGSECVDALRECASVIDEEIEVDYTRAKPVCKITGEAWAQLTEGDGNFRMFAFLESQGAEVLAEPLMTWFSYLLDSAALRRIEEKEIPARTGKERALTRMVEALREVCLRRRQWLPIRLASRLLHREYERMRMALRGAPHPQVSQAELRRLARPFYNYKITGGEGHMEIGKTLFYSVHGLCHMVLSLKPFGCLPSTQSDGAQAAALAHCARQGHNVLYLPVETSGEADIHAYSRVQMTLGDAKARCKQEFEACLSRIESGGTRLKIENLRRYCTEHRDLRRPLQPLIRHKGVVGKAANFVLEVASRVAAEEDGKPCPNADWELRSMTED